MKFFFVLFLLTSSLSLSCVSPSKQTSQRVTKKSNRSCGLNPVEFWNTSADHYDPEHSRFIVSQLGEALQERTNFGQAQFQKRWNTFNTQVSQNSKPTDQVVVNLTVLLIMQICNIEQGLFSDSTYQKQAETQVSKTHQSMKQQVATYPIGK